ncbi:MAG: glycosyltransferase family 2 protein [Elusimicrobia bacterium]|nr:glycosyltransferase family 2 protein [Elusimicrobiota bacterium]
MKDRRPIISIVIPYLNARRFFQETLESVRAQSLRDWELVLVDDGSTDSSREIAASFSRREPGKVRCAAHPGGAHRGTFASRLLGARRARADVIAFLDADDVWEPGYLEAHLRRWRRLKKAGIGLSYGPALYWFYGRPAGARDFIHAMPCARDAVFGPGELLQNFLSSGFATAPRPSAALVGRQAVLELARFEPAARRLPRYEDQFLLWGLAMRRPVAVHHDVKVRYRQRCALKERPRRYWLSTLRDEAGFLPVIRRELSRLLPDHPLLGPAGIPARLGALRAPGRVSPCGDYFFERVPPALRRLCAARA